MSSGRFRGETGSAAGAEASEGGGQEESTAGVEHDSDAVGVGDHVSEAAHVWPFSFAELAAAAHWES